MENLFFSLKCYEEKIIPYSELKNKFDNNGNRFLAESINNFIYLNKEMFEFLDIDISHNIEKKGILIKSGKFVGSIPLLMPGKGTQGGDLQVYPRFSKTIDSTNKLSDLCQLSSILSYSIEPELKKNKLILKNKNQMIMPLYHEAIKYIDLFHEAIHIKWFKFSVIDNISNYPKSSTNWTKYIYRSIDPNRSLEYPVHTSVINEEHKEWQQLRYVFDICTEIINDYDCPMEIYYEYNEKIKSVNSLAYNIHPIQTKLMRKSVVDPNIIKKLKDQANVILTKNSNINYPWRIDCSSLFEKYVQHLIKLALSEINNESYNNLHINGHGNIPSWGLKYLEPDIFIKLNNITIMADAKYKSYFMSYNVDNSNYKEEFRSDLHQLLAYCSFINTDNKIGIFFCPTINEYNCKKINYYFNELGINNEIYIISLPFGVNEIDDNKDKIKQFFNVIDKQYEKL